MKQILFAFFMLSAFVANAQWPNNPNKLVLGRQTTGDGLVFRGSGFPNYTPTTNKNAYVYADTTNGRVYVHIGSWLQVYPDAGDNDRDSTNEVQSIDSLYLSGNILRLKLEGSAGMGLDLSALNTAETDPVWLSEKGQYVTIASTATWDKDTSNDITTSSVWLGDLGGVGLSPQVTKIRGVTVNGAFPSTGQILQYNGSQWIPTSITLNSGTVTSVSATGGAGISVTGSPITSSGTLTITNTGDTDPNNDLTTSTAWAGDLTGTGASPIVDGFRGREIVGQASTSNQNNTYAYNQDSSKFYLLPLNTIFKTSVSPVNADSITPIFQVLPGGTAGIRQHLTIDVIGFGGGQETQSSYEIEFQFNSYAYTYNVWTEYAPSYEFEKRALAHTFPRLFIFRTNGGNAIVGFVKGTAPTTSFWVKSKFPDEVKILPVSQSPRIAIPTGVPLNGIKMIRSDNLVVKNVIEGSTVSYYKRMPNATTSGFIQPLVSVNYGTESGGNLQGSVIIDINLQEQGFLETKSNTYNLVGFFDFGGGSALNSLPNNYWIQVKPTTTFQQRANTTESQIKLWVKRVTHNQLIFGVESPNTWYHLSINSSDRITYTDLSTNSLEAVPIGTQYEWNWTSYSAKSYKMPSVPLINFPESGEISNIGNIFKRYNGSQWRRIVATTDATPTTGHVIYWDGTDWNTKADATGGSGTVTSVAATAGAGISISGSPITSSGTLTITNTGDTDATNDITTSSVWLGDLGGVGLSPQVIKIRGVTVNGAFPSTGQVLQYNGSQWIGANINTLPSLQNNTFLLSNGSGGVTTDNSFITYTNPGGETPTVTLNGNLSTFRINLTSTANAFSATHLLGMGATSAVGKITIGPGLSLAATNPATLAVDRLSTIEVLDYPSTSSNSVSSLTVLVSGASPGDVVSIGAPNSIPSGVVYFGYVSSINTVTIRMYNGSGGTVDPVSASFRVHVWKS